VIVWILLTAPAIAYLVVGTFPALSGLQRTLASDAYRPVVVGACALGLAYLLWRLVVVLRRTRRTFGQPFGEGGARAVFHLVAGAGALLLGTASMVSLLGGESARSKLVSNSHILDAIGDLLIVAGIVLAVGAVILFPPFGIAVVAETGAVVLVTTAEATIAAQLVTAGTLYAVEGYILTMAADEEGAQAGGSAGGDSGGWSARARAYAGDERYDALSKDPKHGITEKTRQEAEAGLGVEERGDVRGPLTRDPSGDAEFFDGNHQAWDVKQFDSTHPGRGGQYTLEDSMAKIQKEIRTGENVIVDTRNITAEEIAELRQGVLGRTDWIGKVKFWP
jgi:hypothetical protein